MLKIKEQNRKKRMNFFYSNQDAAWATAPHTDTIRQATLIVILLDGPMKNERANTSSTEKVFIWAKLSEVIDLIHLAKFRIERM